MIMHFLKITILSFLLCLVFTLRGYAQDTITFDEAWKIGERLGQDALNEVNELRPQVFTGKQGVLVAEGDSWFDYGFTDVLNVLESEYQYDVRAVSHGGDSLEQITYNREQLADLTFALKKIRDQKKIPKAILLSGGGNDIAGEELVMLLNHANSGLHPVSNTMLDEIMNVRMRTAYISLIGAVTKLSKEYFKKEIPILVHGYDYPVPDNRGVLGGFWVLPGPWLHPSFSKKGHIHFSKNIDDMEKIINELNVMLRNLANDDKLRHVHFVELTGTLSRELRNEQYKHDWTDELHPTRSGFRDIAKKFEKVLLTLP